MKHSQKTLDWVLCYILKTLWPTTFIVRLYLVSLVSMSSHMLLDAERSGQDVALQTRFVCSIPGDTTHSSYLRNFKIRRYVPDFIHDLIFGFKCDFCRHLSSLLEPLNVYTAHCRVRGKKRNASCARQDCNRYPEQTSFPDHICACALTYVRDSFTTVFFPDFINTTKQKSVEGRWPQMLTGQFGFRYLNW